MPYTSACANVAGAYSSFTNAIATSHYPNTTDKKMIQVSELYRDLWFKYQPPTSMLLFHILVLLVLIALVKKVIQVTIKWETNNVNCKIKIDARSFWIANIKTACSG